MGGNHSSEMIASILKHALTVAITAGAVGGVGYTQQVAPVRGALNEVSVTAAQMDKAFDSCQKRLTKMEDRWHECMEDCAHADAEHVTGDLSWLDEPLQPPERALSEMPSELSLDSPLHSSW